MNVPWIECHDEPVQLHSGGRSHYLVRADLMFEDERIRAAVLATWWEALDRVRPIRETRWEVTAIPTGGTAWAEALQAKLPLNAGMEIRRVVVDDVLTTGKSFQAYEHGQYSLGLVVVDRSLSAGTAIRSWARIPLPLEERP